MWGKLVRLSEVLEKDAPHSDFDWMTDDAHDHTIYHCSMMVMELNGISLLDKLVSVKNEEGAIVNRVSLHSVFMGECKMSDNHSVIVEIHPWQGGGHMEVIVPNTLEAESFIGFMNHHLPAFLLNYLLSLGLTVFFVTELVRKSCDPILFMLAHRCKWDPKILVITKEGEVA